jgi:hypothetical protein
MGERLINKGVTSRCGSFQTATCNLLGLIRLPYGCPLIPSLKCNFTVTIKIHFITQLSIIILDYIGAVKFNSGFLSFLRAI